MSSAPLMATRPAARGDAFLEALVARKRREVDELSSPTTLELAAAPAVRSFADALTGAQGTAVIAEIKRASPSAGPIASGLDAVAHAQAYVGARASAISVLTDGPAFGGSLSDLRRVRAIAGCPPVLCKDIIVSEGQIRMARAAGADAVLLIVAAVSEVTELAALKRCAEDLGMDVLVEVHNAAELEVAVAVDAVLIGVNSRDLRTFTVDLATGEELLPAIPESAVGIAESGIRSVPDATRMVRAGARALLVGEALVRAERPQALLDALRTLPAVPR